MSKPILFYAETCPDTAPFVAELDRLGVDYDEVEIMTSLPNLKQFIRLRDSNAEFDNSKANGYLGIPALLLPNGDVVLDLSKLKAIFGVLGKNRIAVFMQPYEKYLKLNSQKLRVVQTDAERKLWQRINRDQLLGFRFNRQKPLLSYIVDFYCAKAKLIIELDGSQHYEPDYQEKDALRDAELNSLGFTVVRFSNDEVMREIEAVIEQIYLFLENVRAD